MSVLGAIGVILISFITLTAPGILFSLALLKRTHLHIFEIIVIGFIFGLIATPTLTWMESYAIPYVHAFSFSLTLFNANALVLTLIGLALCYKEGVFEDYGLMKKKHKEERAEEQAVQETVKEERKSEKTYNMKLVWSALLIIMLLAFFMRIANLGVSPIFFEFDPYFDMMSAHSILTLGYQYLNDTSAWPIVLAGTNHRIQPIVPYLTAYWYDLANALLYHHPSFSTSLMSYAGSFYPPIVAALLAFSIFMLIYHEYDPYLGLIGATFVATMPTLVTTFIAGEQLVEPWGIFTLFFFFATYMLAIKNMKSARFAILAGIAFASTFLGAHYYTVDIGVLALFIIVQASIDFLKDKLDKDFFKMNAIVIIVIALFMIFYYPYGANYGGGIPSVFGLPLAVGAPLLALVFAALLYYGLPFFSKRKIIFKDAGSRSRISWLILILVIALIFAVATPLRHTIHDYLSLSARFTTPSSALFMTVAEFEPSGVLYNFGASGFGILSPQILGAPLLLWFVIIAALFLLELSILYKNAKTEILYMAIAIPLVIAGMMEVKYLPHFGVAYIMLMMILLGEIIFMIKHRFRPDTKVAAATIIGGFAIGMPAAAILGLTLGGIGLVLGIVIGGLLFGAIAKSIMHGRPEENHESIHELSQKEKTAIAIAYAIGLFFVSTVLGIIYLLLLIFWKKDYYNKPLYWTALLFIAVLIGGIALSHSFIFGESASLLSSIGSAMIYYGAHSATAACSSIASSGLSVGYGMLCNTVPSYWITAAAWMRQNVGPNAPRILAWWDYGDWINWFGGSNAVLRGDNAKPLEDYATAASFVLGPQLNFTPLQLANMMNTNETKYVVFSNGLVQKWQALDFLACVDINATSEAYAKAQAAGTGTPYVLGSSPCEIAHDPQFALVPYYALVQSNITQSLNYYCTISNSTSQYIKSYLVVGSNLSNHTVCVKPKSSTSPLIEVYNSSGSQINAYLSASNYLGVVNLGGAPYIEFLMIYTPNSANGTITDAPSQFYTSNFYKGYFLDQLPGFTQVYPSNAIGINYVNGTYPIRIFALDNFTGSLPPLVQKPSWVHNNYTLP
jgi:hypothetical protein